MKEWFYTLICMAFLGICAKLLLPAGEKSKLYPPVRFLVSLCMVLAVFSPLLKLRGTIPQDLSSFFEGLSSPDTEEAERLLLERSAEEMSREIRASFPEAEFTLYIYTDENAVPTEISVEAKEGEGARIADFLEMKYGIPSNEYKKGEDENESLLGLE